VGVRLSVFDVPPFESDGQRGRPVSWEGLGRYELGFGLCPENPLEMDLNEPIRLIRDLQQLGVVAINVTAGSPYYSPHIQRPAIFPPSDGYPPPEDPLVGVVRQIQAARRCKEAVPGMLMVGTGYTYLQEFVPNVAQAVIRRGWIDLVGLGRMVLSYPEMPRDCLEGRSLRRKQVCRTFSDCTTGPRNNLVSGCYPLDTYYKQLDAAQELRRIKSGPPRGSL
jgi:2,4-dienoyl-CoA reductase-like NADH-dependent reductase (Old Yellow Enzyme family)